MLFVLLEQRCNHLRADLIDLGLLLNRTALRLGSE